MDDIPTNRILLQVRLAAAFYDVIQASTGAKALDLVARHAPDLVLIGTRLGDYDSLDLCRAITGIAAADPPLTDVAPLHPPAS